MTYLRHWYPPVHTLFESQLTTLKKLRLTSIFQQHLLEMHFHFHFKDLWAIQNLTEITFIPYLFCYFFSHC